MVVAAGLLAYHNSFTGPFTFDDRPSILENPTIRHLWPIWQPLSPPHRDRPTVEGRPVINLSFAINYALGGYGVWGYHALNLTVHVLAGLTLLGVVRRTLLAPTLVSVTCVSQRAESLMGLFYLLTLYCFIRGVESPVPRLWYGLSMTACALGMASKEVMVSAPLMALLYDRTFVSGSFRESWRRRWPLYLGLSATWALLSYSQAGAVDNAWTSAPPKGVTRWTYLLTEPGVILHYLRLSVWPHPLCLDYYGWPMARTWASILPPAVVIVILLGASAWAWKANSAWGFLGAWFFLILAPSSSFIPLDAPAYEHRMYLPLSAVIVAGVMGIHALARQRTITVVLILVIGLGILTWRRNQDYRSEISIWEDTVAKGPDNTRAHYNLGVVLGRAGRNQEEVEQYVQALRLKPDYAEAYHNLGVAASEAGKPQEAIKYWEQALRIKPDYAEAYHNLGIAAWEAGKPQEAIKHWEQALRINPDYAEAHNDLGIGLERSGRLDDALLHYEQAVRLAPDYAKAHSNLANALMRQGKLQEAIRHYEQVVRIQPNDAEAYNNLGSALLRSGRAPEAIQQYEQALRLKPDSAEAHYNLGVAFEQIGRLKDAAAHYERALRINPSLAEAQNRLARLRAAQ